MKNWIRLQRKYLAIPYAVFLVLFVIAPIILIVYYAFTDNNGYPSLDAAIEFFS